MSPVPHGDAPVDHARAADADRAPKDRSGLAVVGVGAAACAACCAGPILGVVGTAGVAGTGGAAAGALAGGAAIVAWRRRRHTRTGEHGAPAGTGPASALEA